MQPDVYAERKVETPLKLRVVNRYVGRDTAKAFRERDVVRLIAFWRADAIAGGAEADHRHLGSLHVGEPVSGRAHLMYNWVVFEAQTQPWRHPHRRVDAPPRAFDLRVDVADREHELLIELPRTEEAAFAGSPGSRGDLQRALLLLLRNGGG